MFLELLKFILKLNNKKEIIVNFILKNESCNKQNAEIVDQVLNG